MNTFAAYNAKSHNLDVIVRRYGIPGNYITNFALQLESYPIIKIFILEMPSSPI